MKEAMHLALDAVPAGVDAAAVRAHLAAVPGVSAIHDLHIWGMSTTETALTCHLVMPQGHPGDAALAVLAHELEARFGIHHATLQIELGDSAEACALTPEANASATTNGGPGCRGISLPELTTTASTFSFYTNTSKARLEPAC